MTGLYTHIYQDEKRQPLAKLSAPETVQ